MNVLGIETSCDETAAAVVTTTGNVHKPWSTLSNTVASQADIHREWGGIVPEIASRQHVRDICGVVQRALDVAKVTWSDIDAIAVTQGPGLVGSLLVGVAFAKALSATLGKPIVAVHHLAGHIESIFLEHGEVACPHLSLVVSGGHTNLYSVPTPGVYRLVGRTRDDAAGEAYDKVARVLGLGYPGGPVIDRTARTGNDAAVPLSAARFTHRDRNPISAEVDDVRNLTDFSFSGLKTAVIRYLEQRGVSVADGLTVPRDASPLSTQDVADLCASFQRVVVDTLVDRTFEAARRLGALSVGISGGVSANSRLRHDALARGTREGLPVYLPALSLSTDNAAMIAAAGLRRIERGDRSALDFNATASLPIAHPS